MYKLNTKWEYINEFIDKDLFHDKNIVLFIDNLPYFRNINGINKVFCPYSHQELIKTENDKYIFIQVESNAIIPNILNTILFDNNTFNLFDYILTFDEQILSMGSKCVKFLPYTKYYWVRSPKEFVPNLFLQKNGITGTFEYKTNKDCNVTFVVGHKNYCPGHKLRHEIWNRQNEIIIKKKFFYSHSSNGVQIFPENLLMNHRLDKTSMFEDSMFAIVIENNKSNNYFTEKLIDCIVSKTLPIYYGCPNISEFFDTNGMIIFDNADELINLVNNLTPDDYYNRLQYIENNFNKWLGMKSFCEQVEDLINTKI